MSDHAAELNDLGRVWLRGALTGSDLKTLDATNETTSKSRRTDLTSCLADVLGPAGTIAALVSPFYPDAFPSHVISFNKSAQSSWGLPWHQDRVIAVKEKHDVSGFSNWSSKAGRWHCEPPLEILEEMLFLRVHLDNDVCESGAMEIALGSHKLGVIPSSQANDVAQQHKTETCPGQRGDVLVLKMLTLHRSAPSKVATPRRVMRVDYANSVLPKPLEWCEKAE